MNAEERGKLVGSIVRRLQDYRHGEITPISAENVLSWWRQFDQADRAAVLRQTERLLRATYVTKAFAREIVANLCASRSVAGDDPASFWKSVGFLRIQEKGASQTDMLALFDEALQQRFGLSTASQTSKSKTYVYVDDVVCSGTRVKYDLKKWLVDNDITNATVHVISIVLYRGGEYNAEKTLLPLFAERGSTLKFRSPYRWENRKWYVKDSQVFWPTEVPNDGYVAQWKASLGNHPEFVLRPPGGVASSTLFASEQERHIVERAFFKKGAYIFSLPANPKASMRPLGYSILTTPGFGATFVTYRNCPNNAPLPLWWGDPGAAGPISGWIPLMPRRTQNQGADNYGF